MAHEQESVERAILEGVTPRLEAEGYTVLYHPPATLLPPFMKSYRPDAVALRPGGRNIAIEVLPHTRATTADAVERKLNELFSGHDEWELRVLYASPDMDRTTVATADPAQVREVLDSAAAMSDVAGGLPALLAGWSALEAAGRALAPDALARPRSPSQLLESLAMEGIVTPAEAATLRALVPLRNRAAHGDLGVRIDRNQIEQLLGVVRTLLELRPSPAAEGVADPHAR